MFIVNANEGQKVSVGDRLFTVLSMTAPGVVLVHVDGEPAPVPVSWDRKVELFPGVLVAIERNLGFAQRIKFLFDAPREVRIRELPNDPQARHFGH